MSRPTLGRWILQPAPDASEWSLCVISGSPEPAEEPREIARLRFTCGPSGVQEACAACALIDNAPGLLDAALSLAARNRYEGLSFATGDYVETVENIGRIVAKAWEGGAR